jgi:RNA polymerase sigma factor (TIGR02999 family)
MSEVSESAQTALLFARWTGGDQQAIGELVTRLYGDIHAIAVRELRSERRLTIRPTALVHEVYLRMANLQEMKWQDRSHFLAMAARVTRQALVDEARRSRAEKRDGGTPVTLSDEILGGFEVGYDALDIEAILSELQGFDEMAAEVVTLRVFGGLSIEEAAEALSLSVRTTNRRWAAGKAWLTHSLRPNG